MIKASHGAVALALAVLAGCAQDSGFDAAPVAAGARTEMRDASGAMLATASVVPSGSGLRVRVEAAGLAPGTYGSHVHAVGRCDAPDFASAGPHWNPTNREHGTRNPQGSHLGDLPNLMVGTGGEGMLEFTIESASLAGPRGLLDADGAAVVVHAQPDDYVTDPSGNSGTRIACGILG